MLFLLIGAFIQLQFADIWYFSLDMAGDRINVHIVHLLVLFLTVLQIMSQKVLIETMLAFSMHQMINLSGMFIFINCVEKHDCQIVRPGPPP